MADFTSHGRLGNLEDIQKTYMWELFIPDIAELNQDDMVLRVRNVVIPGRTITPIESFFMGTKQFFPGKTEYTGNLPVQFEEFEDAKVHTALDSWMQLMFDHGRSDLAGNAGGDKKVITKTITLRMYKGTGEILKEIEFFHAWPQSVADATLDYTASDSVKYDAIFQFDFWRPKGE